MKQALHIFRKDVKHLWPELAVMGTLLAMFCVLELHDGVGAAANPMTGVLGSLMQLLLLVMWLVLIARVVHEESLVGDQQYWVTRPYDWRSLLGAKALFVAAWVALPFLAMQSVMLLEVGLGSWTDPAAMLWMLLKVALVLWLPMLAIVVVTANLPQSLMVVVGVLLLWAALLTAFGNTAAASAPFSAEILATVMSCLLAGCVIYAYATRKTRQARMLLAGSLAIFIVLLGCLGGIYLHGVTNVLMRWHYPLEASRMQLVWRPELSRAHGRGESAGALEHGVLVHLPLVIEGLSEGEHVHETSARYSLDAPGVHYASVWQTAIPEEDGLTLVVPRAVFQQVKAGAVRMHVSLAAELLTLAETRVTTASAEFAAPEGGNCILASELVMNNLVCRFAYRVREPMWVTAKVTAGQCGDEKTERLAGAEVLQMPVAAKPEPVVAQAPALGGRVCPGTPVTFRVSKDAGNLRMEADVPGVILAPYVLH